MNFRWNQLLFSHHIGEEEWWREGGESLAKGGISPFILGDLSKNIGNENINSQRRKEDPRGRIWNDINDENYDDSRNDECSHVKASSDKGKSSNNVNHDLLSTIRSIETCYLDRSHSERLERQDLAYVQYLLTALTHSSNIRSIKLSNLTLPIASLIELFGNNTTMKEFIMFQAAAPSISATNSRDDNEETEVTPENSNPPTVRGVTRNDEDVFRSNAVVIGEDEDANRSMVELAKAIVSCQSLERIELLHNVLFQTLSAGDGTHRALGSPERSDNGDVHSCIHLAISVLQCVRRQAHLAESQMLSNKPKRCYFQAGPWNLSFDIGAGASSTPDTDKVYKVNNPEPSKPLVAPLKVSLEYDIRKESNTSDSMRINELFNELSMFGSNVNTRNPIHELRISMVRSKTGAVVANQDDNDHSSHQDSTMNRNVIMCLSDLLLSSSCAPQSIHLSGMVFDQMTLPMLWRALSSSKGCFSLSFSYCWFNVDIQQPGIQRQLKRRIVSLRYLTFIENSCRSDSTTTITNNNGTATNVNLIEMIVLNLMKPSAVNRSTNKVAKVPSLQVLRCTGFSSEAIAAVFEEIINSDLRLEVLDFGTILSPPFDGDKVKVLCTYVPRLRRLKHLRMSLLTSDIPVELVNAVKRNNSLERFDVWEAQSNLYYLSGNTERCPDYFQRRTYTLKNKGVAEINSICERNKCLKEWLKRPDVAPEYLWPYLFQAALELDDYRDVVFQQLLSTGGQQASVTIGDYSLSEDDVDDDSVEDHLGSWLGMIRATITALT